MPAPGKSRRYCAPSSSPPPPRSPPHSPRPPAPRSASSSSSTARSPTSRPNWRHIFTHTRTPTSTSPCQDLVSSSAPGCPVCSGTTRTVTPPPSLAKTTPEHPRVRQETRRTGPPRPQPVPLRRPRPMGPLRAHHQSGSTRAPRSTTRSRGLRREGRHPPQPGPGDPRGLCARRRPDRLGATCTGCGGRPTGRLRTGRQDDRHPGAAMRRTHYRDGPTGPNRLTLSAPQNADRVASVPALRGIADEFGHAGGGVGQLDDFEDPRRPGGRLEVGEAGAYVLAARPQDGPAGGPGIVQRLLEVIAPPGELVKAVVSGCQKFGEDARRVVLLVKDFDLQLARVGEGDRQRQVARLASVDRPLPTGADHEPRPDPQLEPGRQGLIEIAHDIPDLPDRTR